MRHRVAVIVTATATVGILAALGSWQVGWLGGSRARHAGKPVLLGEVPAALPDEGVRINNVVLGRWTSAPSRAMSASQAIKAALLRDSAGHLRPVNLRDVPSWVITFTSPKPIDVSTGPPGSGPTYVTHFSVVLNAVTRAFVVGFFTR